MSGESLVDSIDKEVDDRERVKLVCLWEIVHELLLPAFLPLFPSF